MTADHGERGLVLRAREGDEDAFAALVRAHEVNIRRLAAGMLLDEVEAEDAAQEAFVRAWKALPRFRGDSAFSTWIHRIAANHCRDILRARARRHWLSWDGLLEALGREPAEAAGPAEAATRGAEARDELFRLLGGLPPDQRAVLILRELNGMSYAEIAETVGRSTDSVRATLRRAREAARHFSRAESV